MKHYHKNPRQITSKQLADLSQDLKALGDLSGITHDLDTDEILTGNQRCEALPGIMTGLIQPEITHRFDEPTADGTAMLGYFIIDGKMYNYRAVTGWDDKKREKANVVANKRGGAWDFDILANEFEMPDLLDWGFDEKELAGLDFGDNGSGDAEPQIDRAAELLEKWQVKPGDLWQIGAHRLICGDCTDAAVVARVMGGEQAAFSFTDPPYNVGVKYTEETDDAREFEDYKEWCKKWLELMPDKFLLTVGVKRLLWWDEIAGMPQWTIAWIKKNGQSNTGLGGTNKWDPILVYGCEHDGGIDIVEVNNDYSEGIKSSGDHPTAKPVELWKQMILRFGNVGELVYEPFGGTGTAMVACENLGRVARVVEISPEYCALQLERMSAAFPALEIKRIE